ncbi:MAG TPA: DotU family type IV/VI secretion system protein [Burkholderiales bacterium]|jgi:type VI secretion system protein ImpK|nr:DotU family type IV/VI secretion system protein [Burkholderiales bacterium]
MRLADCFIELLSYTRLFLRKPGDPYEKFRDRVESLVKTSAEMARGMGASDEAYRQALFPVVAYVDEAVLTSRWAEAPRWQGQQLQKSLFNTSRAGVEFFQRLEALPAAEKAVREVFYFCLMLGFKGRYAFTSDRLMLDSIKQKQLEVLVEGAETAGLDGKHILFPAAYPAGGDVQAAPNRGRNLAALAWMAGPPVILLLLYGFYYFSLDQLVGNFNLFVK